MPYCTVLHRIGLSPQRNRGFSEVIPLCMPKTYDRLGWAAGKQRLFLLQSILNITLITYRDIQTMLKGILKYLVIVITVLFILNIVIKKVDTQEDNNIRNRSLQPEVYYLEPPENFFIENYEKVA